MERVHDPAGVAVDRALMHRADTHHLTGGWDRLSQADRDAGAGHGAGIGGGGRDGSAMHEAPVGRRHRAVESIRVVAVWSGSGRRLRGMIGSFRAAWMMATASSPARTWTR